MGHLLLVLRFRKQEILTDTFRRRSYSAETLSSQLKSPLRTRTIAGPLFEANRDRIAVSTGLTRTGCGVTLQSIPFSVDLADWVSGIALPGRFLGLPIS
jgi:hypothetical protein